MNPSDLPQATQRALGLTPKKRKVKKAMTCEQQAKFVDWIREMEQQAALQDRCVFVALRLTANYREHHFARKRRVEKERFAGRMVGASLMPVMPCKITFTRYGAGQLDSDNLTICAKGVRDGIADAMGVNDGNATRITWEVLQAKAPPCCFGVSVSWRPMEATP